MLLPHSEFMSEKIAPAAARRRRSFRFGRSPRSRGLSGFAAAKGIHHFGVRKADGSSAFGPRLFVPGKEVPSGGGGDDHTTQVPISHDLTQSDERPVLDRPRQTFDRFDHVCVCHPRQEAEAGPRGTGSQCGADGRRRRRTAALR